MEVPQPVCNRLGSETSPYLLQHKDNPVGWYPWGDEAFAAARNQDKPIFVSIGYSTCYWCHVMEKDSFETNEVAELLNRYFIPVKVDREERPDVDQLYMDAVVALTGRGGWPMSVFLTPELKPFWGGTFFYRDQFMQIVSGLGEAWRSQREKVFAAGDQILSLLREEERTLENPQIGGLLRSSLRQFASAYDPAWGGFGGAPKFPSPRALSFLLRVARRLTDPVERQGVLGMVEQTLSLMARGGIYDQLGGGFHRYATDERWLIPHFEKMLYDNAQLIECYLEGYLVLRSPEYLSVARESIEYACDNLGAPEGGFYSAQDAGEVGKEGEFYVWKYDELRRMLSAAELRLLEDVHGVSEKGNFEGGTNILFVKDRAGAEARSSEEYRQLRAKLLELRSRREHPHRDEKLIVSWNSFMIGALLKAASVMGDPVYRDRAHAALGFILDNLGRGETLLRIYAKGKASVPGCLEDYAALVRALLDSYDGDYDPDWLRSALKLQEAQDRAFWDPKGGGYFSSSARELALRKKDLIDSATPSGNSLAFSNLLRLYALTGERTFSDKAGRLGQLFAALLGRYPGAAACALLAFDFEYGGARQVAAFPGPEESELRAFLGDTFLPDQVTVLARAPADFPPLLQGKCPSAGGPVYYVCENQTCGLPFRSLGELKQSLSRVRTITPSDGAS